MITIEDIKRAQLILKNIIHDTDMFHSKTFSEKSGNKIYFKAENQQRTGAFKIRGAYNKIYNLTDEERNKGIVAVSAGNHAQGVAYAAKLFGIKATIVMPEYAPMAKIIATQSYGAEVVLEGRNIEEAMQAGLKLASNGMTFIHPFDDNFIIAGQGTVALEMLQDTPNLDAIIVSVGGGGLISGISIAAKSINPNIKIIGVQTEEFSPAKLSLELGENVCAHGSFTFADGIAVNKCGHLPLEYMRQYVDEIVTVTEDEVSNAIFYLLERCKLVVEGAGAAAAAAVLSKKINLQNKNIGVLLSGGNIDLSILQTIIDKGFMMEGRRVELKVIMKDKPGQLKGMAEIVSAYNSNIYSTYYNRAKDGVNPGLVYVSFVLETRNHEHAREIFNALEKNGYKVIL